jgi:hypothetical protein
MYSPTVSLYHKGLSNAHFIAQRKAVFDKFGEYGLKEGIPDKSGSKKYFKS